MRRGSRRRRRRGTETPPAVEATVKGGECRRESLVVGAAVVAPLLVDEQKEEAETGQATVLLVVGVVNPLLVARWWLGLVARFRRPSEMALLSRFPPLLPHHRDGQFRPDLIIGCRQFRR